MQIDLLYFLDLPELAYPPCQQENGNTEEGHHQVNQNLNADSQLLPVAWYVGWQDHPILTQIQTLKEIDMPIYLL